MRYSTYEAPDMRDTPDECLYPTWDEVQGLEAERDAQRDAQAERRRRIEAHRRFMEHKKAFIR